MESDGEHQTNSVLSTRHCGVFEIKVLHLCLISVIVLLLVATIVAETAQPSYFRQGYWLGSVYFLVFSDYVAEHGYSLCKRGRAAAPSDEGPVEEDPNNTGSETESSTNVTHEERRQQWIRTPPADFLFPSEMPKLPDYEELEELPPNYDTLDIPPPAEYAPSNI
ncbi:hypothetical protein Aperf_G00000098489 [Anoplocephala perfoliata]